MEFPVITLGRVFHVGSMNPADLGANSGKTSQEGDCLSVSLCPNAWSQIARIGGQTHLLAKAGATFLDVLELRRSGEAMASVREWGLANGLVEVRDLWRSWLFDDESDDWRSFLFSTAESAFDEALDRDDYDAPDDVPGPDGKPGIEKVAVLVAAGDLSRLSGMECRPDEDATDAMILAWARAEGESALGRGLDGVWWSEDYDPDCLSAPRGGIFKERVLEWKSGRVATGTIDDQETMDEMPATEWVLVGSPTATASL
jgi:hypothetical protein